MEQVQPVTGSRDNKKAIIIGSLIVVLLLLAFWYFYHQGKKTVTIADLPKDDPATQNQSSGVTDATISETATGLYNDMNGGNFWGHEDAPWQTWMSFSDTDFVKTYNYFNTMYQKDSGETLVGWINGEAGSWWSSGFGAIQSAVLVRCAKLNLK